MDPKSSQRLKLSVAAVLLAAAGGIYYMFGRDGGGLSDDINFVCVETGQTFVLDRDAINTVPMPNPKTGRATLLPCSKRDGKLRVDAHYRQVLKEMPGEKTHVDLNTLEVRPG